MSAAPLRHPRSAARPAPSRAGSTRAQADRPPLRPVRAPEASRTLMPFMWVCLTVLVAALAAVLLINTTMAEGAYERRDLKIAIAGLHQESETLRTELEANGAPAGLADRATSLGMAPASALGTVSLSDGTVHESGKQ